MITESRPTTFVPRSPESLEETGLSSWMIDDLLLKRLFLAGPQTAGDLSTKLALPFLLTLNHLNDLRRVHQTHVLGSEGYGERSYVYTLTEDGTERAKSAFERNRYDGAAPVPLDDYVASVKAQSVRDEVITRTQVEKASRDLVLHAEMLNEIGPAINAGHSIFFYGAAGNGKTALATRITRAMGTDVYVPYAIETEGSIIEFYDPVSHVAVTDDNAEVDPRWIRISRPTVVVGGELKLENLDLYYHEHRKTYEAPFQLKANTGVFVIDDFGRQQPTPTELLNRWIVPLELHVDFLQLQTGRKVEVPFDELLVLSTNLDPKSLMDEAFTRRIKYKVKARDPSREMFKQIFRMAAEQYEVPFDDAGFEYLVEEHYVKVGRDFRGVHPRDLLDQLVALCRYVEAPARMSPDLLDAVVHTYFIAAS